MTAPPYDVPVFDCDSHVWEPPAVWDEHLDPSHREAAQGAFRYTLDGTGTATVVVNGRPAPPLGSSGIVRPAIWRPGLTPEVIAALDPRRFHPLNPGAYEPAARLADMDALGIERALLFPTLFTEYLPAVEDAELARLLARAYNDWIHRFCRADRRRLHAAAILPFQAPQAAVAEARRCAALGFRAFVVRPCFHDGRFIHHPGYHGVWRELERLEVAVFLHPAAGGDPATRNSTAGYVERVASGAEVGHAVAEGVAPLLDSALALAVLCFDGFMEKYPGLRIAYSHAGGSCIPMLLERVETYLCVGAPRRDVSLEPSRGFFGPRSLLQVDGWERRVARQSDRFAEIGAWGSRYPNHDASTPAEAMSTLARHRVPPDVVARMMGGNLARFLELETDPTVV